MPITSGFDHVATLTTDTLTTDTLTTDTLPVLEVCAPVAPVS